MSTHTPITAKLVESLYVEAMGLADDARAYFDHDGQADRNMLDPAGRVAFACESLRVTTRLMHVVSWLLVSKALQAGELTEEQATAPERRLGRASDDLDMAQVEALPPRARAIVEASLDLYDRVRRLDAQLGGETEPHESPARALLDRLQASI